MPRKSKESTLFVGVMGTGAVTGKPGIEALTEQFVEANGPVTFVIPFSDEFFTDSVAAVADWALENEHPVRGIVHTSYDLGEDWLEDLDGPPHETALVRKELQKMLLDADEAALIVLWDDDDKECQAACLALNAEGVPLFEMSSGLAEIEELILEGAEPKDTDDSSTQPEKEPDVAKKKEAPAEEPEEEFQPYTREELETIAEEDRDELKKIAEEDFEIEVQPRVRSNTIIDAILKAQEEEGLVEGDAEEPEEAEVVSEGGDINMDAFVKAVVDETAEMITDLLNPVVTELENLQETVSGLKVQLDAAKSSGDDAPAKSESAGGARPTRRRRR